MQYRNYKDTGEKTSLLGMGCMRLPKLEGKGEAIDYERAQKIIDYAYAHGINYYDTAYVYHGGDSEKFIGQALKKYPRESFNLATKLPGWEVRSLDDVDRIFNQQLKRCQVDYFDFYLCHNVNENSIDNYINLGVPDYLAKLKEQGKIRYLGFSSHGKPETLRRYAQLRNWDFAQIQLNYLDWTMQDAKSQYEILTELGIPVIVMEPVRGGRLASLSPEADEIMKKARPDKSIASWALRYAAALPNVQVILSGMSALDQIADNVGTFDNYEPLTQTDREIIEKAVAILKDQFTIPCTGCRYCIDCPQGLDIPMLLSVYNEYAIAQSPMSLMPLMGLPDDKRPDKCIACEQCMSHCPQNISVPETLSKLADAFAHMPPPPGPPPSAD